MWELWQLMLLTYGLKRQPHLGIEKIRAIQEKRFRRLILYAEKHSPFYRRRFQGIDLARCQLADLPWLAKPEMMAHFDEVLTDRRVKRADIELFIGDPTNLGKLYLGEFAICHTSGSQGQPALVVQNARTMLTNFAVQFARGSVLPSRALLHLSRLWNPARMALVTQRPGFYPSGSAFSYFPASAQRLFKILLLSVFDPVAETVARLNEFQPDFLTGYSSSLEILAREEQAGRLRLRQGGRLKQVTNISELLPPASARWLEQVFGVHVSDQYSMGECMALTCGCLRGPGAHVNADLALLEVVDDEYRPVPDGKRGSKVLLTNLYNEVQPLIRYEIDDMVTASANRCSCGNSMPLIESIEGRSKEKLWIEVGGHYRDLPYYIFLAALHHDLDLAEHQVLQTGVNQFVLRVAPQRGKVLSTERLHQLVHQSVASEGLADLIRFDIQIVERIARGPSGKIERVRNLFGPRPGPPDFDPQVPTAASSLARRRERDEPTAVPRR